MWTPERRPDLYPPQETLNVVEAVSQAYLQRNRVAPPDSSLNDFELLIAVLLSANALEQSAVKKPVRDRVLVGHEQFLEFRGLLEEMRRRHGSASP